MFTLKVTRPDGESKEFPLTIFKSSIFVGLTWEPCASFHIPDEAGEFLDSPYAGDTIVYAYHEGGVTRDYFEVFDDDGEVTGEIEWELLIDGKPCTHDEFSTKSFNQLLGVPA